MGIYEKSENWWLKLIVVVVVVGSLALIASMNRVTTETTKSLQSKVDSLTSKNDVLIDSIFYLNHEIGINELVIDNLSQQPKWKGLSKAVEKETYESNKYE